MRLLSWRYRASVAAVALFAAWRVLTSQPHIQLIPPDEVAWLLRQPRQGRIVDGIVQRPAQRTRSIDQWQKIRTELSGWPEIVTVSPTMGGAALAVGGDASRSITVTGIDPDVCFKIVRLPDYIVAGRARVRRTTCREGSSRVSRLRGRSP